MIEQNVSVQEFLGNNSTIFEIYRDLSNYERIEPKLKQILSVDISAIIEYILQRKCFTLHTYDIPLFSNLNHCTVKICFILAALDNCGLSFQDIGKKLLNHLAKANTYYKYGETHAKTASILGLTKIVPNKPAGVYLTNLGYYFIEHPENKDILFKCLLRPPIIQFLLQNCQKGPYTITDAWPFLSASTAKRRTSSVKCLLKKLANCPADNLQILLKNLLYQR